MDLINFGYLILSLTMAYKITSNIKFTKTQQKKYGKILISLTYGFAFIIATFFWTVYAGEKLYEYLESLYDKKPKTKRGKK